MKQSLLIIFTILSLYVFSQENIKGQLHGNFNIDVQQYSEDTIIGASKPSELILMNAYGNFNYTYGNFSAGLRYEAYLNSLEGFDKSYNGQGIAYKYLSYKNQKDLGIIVGNFYEQFGSGLILRSYQEKMLGYDNAFEGVKVNYSGIRGVSFKGLIAKQRLFWTVGDGIVRAIDGDFSINEMFQLENNTQITIGGSFVSKFQADKDPILKLPENVGSGAARLSLSNGGFMLSSEYAYKSQDPSSDNGYIYKNGEALLINATYSAKGIGVYLSAKRVDNMSFRSDRGQKINNLNINYIPDISKIHTYTLASMYQYATQTNGEMGTRAEIMYKFKKESFLGGKNGTEISVSYATAYDINRVSANDTTAIAIKGYDGYKSNFFEIGDELFYNDLNIGLHKKIGDKFKLNVEYLNQTINYEQLRGEVDHSGNKMVYSNIGIVDLTWKIKSKRTLRFEFQGLFTKQDKQDWAMGLIEYTMAPHWFIAVYDAYNYGNLHSDLKIHYVNTSVGYMKNSTRIQLSYGKSMEGVICVGGVCRVVPATNGFALSITSSF